MTEKVELLLAERPAAISPGPASAEALAQGYVSQLTAALNQGAVHLSITCADPAALGLEPGRTAHAVLRAVVDFLYDHPQVQRLSIRCAGQEAWRAYSFQWNLWFAAHKPPHQEEREQDL